MLHDPNKEVDLSNPSFKGLAFLLRNKGLWPKGFEWDYNCRGQCALGLADVEWGINAFTCCKEFASYKTSYKAWGIFYGGFLKNQSSDAFRAVTPEMVADQIDKYLAE